MEAVKVPDELVQQGLPRALECLGPVQSYEMFEEVQQWTKRVEQNPVLALSRDTWRDCYTTPLFRNWGAYHEWLHSKGHGRNAAGAQTEDTYWQLCRDTLLDGLEGYKSQGFRDGEGGEPYNLMLKLITVFCGAAWQAAERDNNDYGWFTVMHPRRPPGRQRCEAQARPLAQARPGVAVGQPQRRLLRRVRWQDAPGDADARRCAGRAVDGALERHVR
jgi:hypothetical protein